MKKILILCLALAAIARGEKYDVVVFGATSEGVTAAAIQEGSFYQKIPGAYPISCRTLTPKPAECENLLVPACCSASHAAYAIRADGAAIHDPRSLIGHRGGSGH